jgi:hypothetical protein
MLPAGFAGGSQAMNREAIGAFSEILGAVAVVVSLIYVAAQVNKSNRQAATPVAKCTIEQDF